MIGQQRRIAGQDQQRAVPILQQRLRHLHGMAGAFLLGLQDVLQFRAHGGLDLLGLMPHHQHRPARACSLRGFDRPAQERLAQQQVQGFGPLGLHARAFAGGEDKRGDTAGILGGRRIGHMVLLRGQSRP